MSQHPETRSGCLVVFLSLLGLGGTVAAQGLGPRHVTRPSTEREATLDERCYWQDRLIVKFREGTRVRLVEATGPASQGRLDSPDGLPLDGVRTALGESRLERVFTREVGDLDRERAALLARAPASEAAAPADLNNYFRAFTAGRTHTLRLLDQLLADPAVETAYPEFHPGAVLPAQDPAAVSSLAKTGQAPLLTPFFEPLQKQLGPAPAGLGVEPVQSVLGAQGRPGQIIAQIEAAWSFLHEDVPQLRRDRLVGATDLGQYDTLVWRDHGTAAVGILVAARDGKGVRGMVPRSHLLVSSISGGYGNAVSVVTARAGPGDVFSSSMVYAAYYQNKGYHAPFDLPQDVYDAIRTATLKGIVVTIAAGNTSVDLATKEIYGTRYLPLSTPSGAVVTGASEPGPAVQASWSNHGDVIELCAWGASIATTGYGHTFRSQDAPERRDYTVIFGGTSSASPQVAGILASVQSVSFIHTGKVLAPRELIDLVKATGTSIQGRVGIRPDLEGALRRLGFLAGLRASAEVVPGHALPLEILLPRDEVFAIYAAPATGQLAIPGKGFPLLLDLPSLFFLVAGSAKANVVTPISVPTPTERWLEGAHLYLQALRLDAVQTRFDLTNAIDCWLREPLRP